MIDTRIAGPRVIVALDFATAREALAFTANLSPQSCRLKIGIELFTSAGPPLVDALVQKGFDVFLDLKFHDIPSTVARACAAAARLGVWMLNVHALGGTAMLSAAREALEDSVRRPLLVGVTILTSHSYTDLQDLGLIDGDESQVVRLAQLVQQASLDGVVCSAREAPTLRMGHGADFCLVTPGIRPLGSPIGDQQRVATPLAAIQAGADYLVIGRPITQAADPVGVLMAINRELIGAT